MQQPLNNVYSEPLMHVASRTQIALGSWVECSEFPNTASSGMQQVQSYLAVPKYEPGTCPDIQNNRNSFRPTGLDGLENNSRHEGAASRMATTVCGILIRAIVSVVEMQTSNLMLTHRLLQVRLESWTITSPVRSCDVSSIIANWWRFAIVCLSAIQRQRVTSRCSALSTFVPRQGLGRRQSTRLKIG